MTNKEVQTSAQGNLFFLDGHTKKIKDTINKVKDDFVYIGFLLWEVRQYKYYEVKGYSNVVEYAEKELGFKKRATYNFISVCERFSCRNKSGNPTISIDSKYKDFNFSQLCEVLPISDSNLNEFSSDMTIKQIREVKKEFKNEDEVIKKKDKIDFGKQLDIVDVVKDEELGEELINVTEEIEHLEAANKILKNRKEALEVKHENLKKLSREKDKEINNLKGRIDLSKSSMDNLIERDNKLINDLKKENEKLKKENEKLKKENEKLKKERDKLTKEKEENKDNKKDLPS